MPYWQVLQIALTHLLILVKKKKKTDKKKTKTKNLTSLNFSYMIPNWHLALFIKIYISIHTYINIYIAESVSELLKPELMT